MGKVKVVSFDVEGTLVTLDFSQAVWHEGMPALYARRNGLGLAAAKARLEQEYEKVGDRSQEWYDIKYWFRRFQLGNYGEVLEGYRHKLALYSEAVPVLSSLGGKYVLIAVSNSAREFLPYLLDGIEGYFTRVFSSISDYGELKSPDFYTTVCREMGVGPGEMVHIGDSWHLDFLAAGKAGIEAFHLDRGQERKEGRSLASLTELEARLPGR